MKKINNVKKFLILLVASAFLSVNQVWGQLPYNTTMTQNHFNASGTIVASNKASWSNGISVKTTGISAGFNWDDKYAVIALSQTSIPYQLKFKFACSSGAATNPNWYVAESADNTQWTNVWSTESNSTSKSQLQTVNLSKSTKYIKLCYSGNFGGTFSDIIVSDQEYVSDPVVGEQTISTLDFGAGTISSGMAELSFDVEWCNVSTLNVSSDNPTYFTVSPASFGATARYGSQAVTVQYNRDIAVGTHSGRITMSNGSITKTVTVSGSTTKRTQAINWNDELVATGYTLNAEDVLTGADLATSDNEDAVLKYTSSNPDIIAVSPDSTTLVAMSEGTALITAFADGNNIYEAGTDAKTFTVTALKKQVITWEQNLLGLKTDASIKTILLEASATSGGTITYAIESETASCITLSGENNATLTITGIPGEAYIIATQSGGVIGDEEWISATLRKQVKVRDPNSACDEYALADESFTFSRGDKTSMSEKTYNLTGKPTQLSFSAKWGGKKYAWSEQESMYIEQYANFGSGLEWKQIAAVKIADRSTTYGPYHLEETATKIRFRSGEYGQQDVSNISIRRMKELVVSESNIVENAERNVQWSKTVSVSRSNVDVVDIQVTSDSANCPFRVSKSSIGVDCADRTTETFDIYITPREKNTTYTGKVVITDGKSIPTTHTINLSITAVAFNQTIHDFELPETCTADVDTITFAATATSELPVVYLSSDSSIAYVNDENRLVILSAGSVTITAYQEGNDKYNSTEIAKSIVITKVKTSAVVIPSASGITFGQALSASVLSEGEGSVEGSFAWADETIVPSIGENAYAVIFTPDNNAIYDTAMVSVFVTVDEVDAELILAPTAYDTLVYNGEEQVLIAAGEAVGGTLQYSLGDQEHFADTLPTAVKAGDYTIYYRVVGDEYHSDINVEEPLLVSIAYLQAELTLAPVAYDTLVYNGEEQVLITAGEAVGGTLEYSLDGNQWSSELPTASEIGQYTVYYRVNADDNHNGIAPDSLIVNIVKAEADKMQQEIYWDQELTVLNVGSSDLIYADASSYLDVYFTTSDSSIVSVVLDESGWAYVITALKPGTVEITARQDGNDDWAAAQPVVQTLTVIGVETPTDVNELVGDGKATKLIRDNQLLIIRDKRTYTTTGLLVE